MKAIKFIISLLVLLAAIKGYSQEGCQLFVRQHCDPYSPNDAYIIVGVPTLCANAAEIASSVSISGCRYAMSQADLGEDSERGLYSVLYWIDPWSFPMNLTIEYPGLEPFYLKITGTGNDCKEEDCRLQAEEYYFTGFAEPFVLVSLPMSCNNWFNILAEVRFGNSYPYVVGGVWEEPEKNRRCVVYQFPDDFDTSEEFEVWANGALPCTMQIGKGCHVEISHEKKNIPYLGGDLLVYMHYGSACQPNNITLTSNLGNLNYYLLADEAGCRTYVVEIPPSTIDEVRSVNVSISLNDGRDPYTLSVAQVKRRANPDERQNYVFKVKPYVAKNNIDEVYINEAVANMVYYDGLGRPTQEIAAGQSPGEASIIRPIAYDAFGREANTYLPYETDKYLSNWTAEQRDFYSKKLPADASYAFSKSTFENSPLNRVTSQTAPGANWNNKPVRVSYGVNNNEVKLWKVDANGSP